jgi:hypothetical protein
LPKNTATTLGKMESFLREIRNASNRGYKIEPSWIEDVQKLTGSSRWKPSADVSLPWCEWLSCHSIQL